jgi:hypothetical protein
LLTIHVAFGRPQGEENWGYRTDAVARNLQQANSYFRQNNVVDRYGEPCRITVNEKLTASGLSDFVFTPKDATSEGDFDKGPDYGVLWLKWEGSDVLAPGNGPALWAQDRVAAELMTKQTILRAKRPRCELCYIGSMASDWAQSEGLAAEGWLVTRGKGAEYASGSNVDVIRYIVKILNHFKCCTMTRQGPMQLVAAAQSDRVILNPNPRAKYTKLHGKWEKCPTCAPDKNQPWRCMSDHE